MKTLQQGQIDGSFDVVLPCCKAYDLDDAKARRQRTDPDRGAVQSAGL